MWDDNRGTRGELEREVMTALVATGAPMTLEQVRERLDGTVMCTTVMTTLGRLHDRGLTRREQVGRSFVYSALGTQAQLVASRMRQQMETGEDRAAVLAWFVGMLTPDEERLLASLAKAR